MASPQPTTLGRARDLARAMADIELYGRLVLRRPLRRYQLEPARAVARSVLAGRGETFAVMMSRQAGKNETAAHLEAWLLSLYRRRGGTIVKAAPTLRPQGIISLDRLQRLLERAPFSPPRREGGSRLRYGRARLALYSAAPGANVVGATADLLLEGDEAQDLDPDRWQKAFRPMAASTAATTVLWGTAWTADTLLAHTMCALEELERRDGLRRVFRVPWDVVARSVPAYGRYVQGEIARLGADHPLIRTQYLLEDLDDESGMFPAATQALMRGRHDRARGPVAGAAYALLVDVAGGLDVATAGADHPRDGTVTTIVEILPGEVDPLSGQPGALPRYRVMDRCAWTGAPHHTLSGALARLAELWAVRHLVIDATGLGAGLASALGHQLGPRMIPFVFTAASKSRLGWDFYGLCASGRFQDHREDGSPEQEAFWRQVRAARYTLSPGPGQLMQWGVPDPAVHDDHLISAALCAALPARAPASDASHIIEAEDPL